MLIVAGGAALLDAGCSAPGEFVEPPLPGLSFEMVAMLSGGQDASASEGAGGAGAVVGRACGVWRGRGARVSCQPVVHAAGDRARGACDRAEPICG